MLDTWNQDEPTVTFALLTVNFSLGFKIQNSSLLITMCAVAYI